MSDFQRNPDKLNTIAIVVVGICGAVLVYEKPCPCPESMPHSEICCGEQMKAEGRKAPPGSK